MSKDLKEIYNKVAEEYSRIKAPNDKWLNSATVFEFLKKLPKQSRVLDLGCGPGIQSKQLVRLGHKVIGLDYAEEMIKLARQKVKKAEFRVMDIEKLDFPAECFDAVYAQASLIHIKKATIKSVLVKINYILKPKGLFFVTLKQGQGEIKFSEKDWMGLKESKRFFALWQPDEFRKVLHQSGFDVIHESQTPGRTHSWIVFLGRKV